MKYKVTEFAIKKDYDEFVGLVDDLVGQTERAVRNAERSVPPKYRGMVRSMCLTFLSCAHDDEVYLTLKHELLQANAGRSVFVPKECARPLVLMLMSLRRCSGFLIYYWYRRSRKQRNYLQHHAKSYDEKDSIRRILCAVALRRL